MNNVFIKQYRNREGHTITGTNKGWHFTQTPTFVYGSGSLPQLLYETNQMNFTRYETSLALQKLSDILSIDITDAKVTRIDFGYNILMNHEVSTYFKSLCNKTYTDRVPYGNDTLYFKGSTKELCFYNKTAQLRDTFQAINDQYFYKHLLRYELKLTKRLAQSLGFSEITCADLVDEGFYQLMKRAWYDQYISIDKLSFSQPVEYGNNITEF